MLAVVEYGDLLLCQITSKDYGDRRAVAIVRSDFASGSLPQDSYARPGRLLTADSSLVVRTLGQLHETKRGEVSEAVAALLT